MDITIAECLRPYSHQPGTMCILPGTSYCLHIFPGLISIYSLEKAIPVLIQSIYLSLDSPLKQFTVQLDLEKGCMTVWGEASTGFIRYRLNGSSCGNGIQLNIEKAPLSGLKLSFNGKDYTFAAKESVVLLHAEKFESYQSLAQERLSLGNSKAQDWDLVKRRLDLTEILPIWFRLGQMLAPIGIHSELEKGNNFSLLYQCQQRILENKPEYIAEAFLNLFQAGFYGLLTPRLVDDQYQGFTPVEALSHSQASISPLILLQQGSELIRQLFVQEEGNQIKILPFLPPEFHHGRLLNVQVCGGILSMEWTKKRIRRCVFIAGRSGEVGFHFNKVERCRFKSGDRDVGKIIPSQLSITMEKGCHYLFDNFT